MKWQIITIGKPSLSYARIGVEEYQKRLRSYTDLTLLSDARDQGREKNSRYLLHRSEGSLRIALDERGEAWTTADLAGKIEDWQMRGTKKIGLLIGGADGHNSGLREQSDHVISLSAFSLQHELALLVLLEQLYRVHTYLKGEPYHR